MTLPCSRGTSGCIICLRSIVSPCAFSSAVALRCGVNTGLVSATLWGGYGMKHEKEFGSLESGKWADLVILDRDYLTIPVDDIPKIRVLMTMVGGKIVHLVPSLAKEIGMQPTGAQVELGGLAAQW